MRAPTVAVYTLAALAALDLSPKTKDGTPPEPTPTPPEIGNFLGLAQAAQAAEATAVAPPELSSAQLSNRLSQVLSRQAAGKASLKDLQGHWAQPLIEALAKQGIVRGFSDGTFRPNDAIQSEHLTGMLQRAIAQYGTGFSLTYFNNLSLPNQNAALLTAMVLPEASSSDPQSFRRFLFAADATPTPSIKLPKQRMTRAEAVALIYQALAKTGSVPPVTLAKAKAPQKIASVAETIPIQVPPPETASKAAPATQSESERSQTQSSPATTSATTDKVAVVPPVDPKLQVIKQIPRLRILDRDPPTPDPAPASAPGAPGAPGSAPGAPSAGQPELPTGSLPKVDPTQPAGAVPKPPEVKSQLGDLVTGDRSRDFSEYWKSLCKNNPPNVNEALAACDQLLTIRPREARVWEIRGNLLLKGDKYEEAIASYDRALTLAPPATSDLQANRCKALFALDKLGEAIAACDQAIQLDKGWETASLGETWFRKGSALKRLGRNEEASVAFTKALSYDPGNSQYWTEQCRVTSELGKQDLAVASCDRALDANKSWSILSPSAAWQNRALALTRLGKYEQAIAAYDKALEIDPKDASAWTKEGVLLGKLGKHGDALAAHDQAIKVSPNFSYALINRCATLNKLGRFEEALAACDQGIGGDGRWGEIGTAYAWDQRGSALAGLGRLEEALTAADRAIALKPDYAEAWNNRAVTLWRLEEFTKALESIERAITLKSDYSQAWFNKGRILRTLGRYTQAIAAYDQALKGDVNRNDKPTLADIWANRSALLWRMNRYTEALEASNQAIANDPKSALAWYNRGSALMSLNRPSEAIKSFARAIKLDPTYTYAWMGRGIALASVGKYEEALTALDEALRLDPSQTLAQRSREAVLKKLEPPKPAKKEAGG